MLKYPKVNKKASYLFIKIKLYNKKREIPWIFHKIKIKKESSQKLFLNSFRIGKISKNMHSFALDLKFYQHTWDWGFFCFYAGDNFFITHANNSLKAKLPENKYVIFVFFSIITAPILNSLSVMLRQYELAGSMPLQ